MDLSILDSSWQEQQRFLRDGLLDGAIWSRQTGLAISSVGEVREDFIAMITQLLGDVDDTLSGSGFPSLNRYMMFNMEKAGVIVVVIQHDADIFQGVTLDPKRINLGMLFNVAIPKALAKVKEAKA